MKLNLIQKIRLAFRRAFQRKNMAKIAGIDDSLTAENNGLMMLYDVDTHGMATYTRFTVKANGQDESSNHVTFYIIPHF